MRINEIGISAITLAELVYGVSKSSLPEKNKLVLLKFVALLEILPFTARAAQTYGQICAFIEKSGQIIGSLDLLIISHAKSENLILVTNNLSEFSRIPDLKIKNWV
jgi:tRNA(fMet)-specific endonuclease VapC